MLACLGLPCICMTCVLGRAALCHNVFDPRWCSLVSSLVLCLRATDTPLVTMDESVDALTVSLSALGIGDGSDSGSSGSGEGVGAAATVAATWRFIRRLQSSSTAARVGSGPSRAAFLGELLLEFTVLQVCGSLCAWCAWGCFCSGVC
jgi:hypothetical protein